jgi:hypothetical protein
MASVVATALSALAATGTAAAAGQANTASRGTPSSATVRPAAGREGTTVTMTYPSALPEYPKALKAVIEDPGVHGYVIVHNAGVYVAWDDKRDSKYTVPAVAAGDAAKKNAYRVTIPAGVCGIVIKPEQATVSSVPAGAIQGSGVTVMGQGVTTYPRQTSPSKVLSIALGAAHVKPVRFNLSCDTYTLSVTATADPPLVEPLPGSSTVTATLMVRGPAQVEVAARLTKPSRPVMLLTPLANEDVLFDTTFGEMAPASPAKVRTGTDGTASVVVSSGIPGTAAVRGVALGVGDARTLVRFAQPVEQEPAKPSATGQCAAEAEQRHQDVVGHMHGKTTAQIAQALVDSDASSPSVAQCARQKGGGAGASDSIPAATGRSGDPALDAAVDGANSSVDKIIDGVSYVRRTDPEKPKPNPNRKLLLIGAAAGGAAVAIAAGKGGGGGSGTPGGGSSTGGTGGGAAPFDPSTLNGTFSGPVRLQGSSTCQGSDSEFMEKVTLDLNKSGSGTMRLDDSPSFPRSYNVSGVSGLNVSVTSSGTFPFFGASIPGTITFVFPTANTINITETTTWPCTNVYAGAVTK